MSNLKVRSGRARPSSDAPSRRDLRPRRRRRWLVALLAASLACVASPVAGGDRAAAGAAGSPSSDAYRVLVFSKTGPCHRHESIPAGIAAIEELGANHGFAVDATEDDGAFTDANLAEYATVVFLSTQCDPLGTQAAKDAFQRFVQNGGGFVGVHASVADPNFPWPWYDGLVGAKFSGHPALQTATMVVEDRKHPATKGLPERFPRFDEWYDFTADPRPGVRVLTSVDTGSYDGWQMGPEHPLTWCHDYDGGRAFYTAWGHSSSDFAEPYFRQLLLGGIRTTAGSVAADCTPTPLPDGSLAKMPGGAINIAVSSAGTVIAVAPDHRVWRWNGSGWTEILGQPLTRATVRTTTAGQEEIWGLGLDGTTWRHAGSSWARVAGDGVDIAAAAGDGTVWRTDTTGTYRWTGGTSTTDATANWELVPGTDGGVRLVQASGRTAEDLWGVTDRGRVVRFDGTRWHKAGGRLTWISAAADGTVQGVTPDGTVVRYDGKRWVERPGPLTQLSVGDAGTLWGVDARTRIFRTTG